MRPTLGLVVTAAVAATLSAVVATARSSAEPRAEAPAPQPVHPERVDGSARLPPGWDPRFAERLARVEQQVAQSAVQTRPAVAPEGEPPREPQDDREQLRSEQYQQELTDLRQALDEHAREPFDSSWAPDQERSIDQAFAKQVDSKAGAKLENVDCRSKTCVAKVSFPTPDDAVMHLVALSDASAPGCGGLSITLEPPSAPGRYQIKAVYHCR
jgi:hypothetical protein